MLLILSSSPAGQQRAGCPHTAKALKPNAEAAPPKAIVTRSCVTAPKDNGPRLHSFSCRQSAGFGGGSDGNGGRGPKLKLEKETRVSSRSSQRPTSLNSASEELDSVLKDALVICWGSGRASAPHCCAWRLHCWPGNILLLCIPLVSSCWSLICIFTLSFLWNLLWSWARSELVLISSLLQACPWSIPQGHSSTSSLHSSTRKPNFSVTWE